MGRRLIVFSFALLVLAVAAYIAALSSTSLDA